MDKETWDSIKGTVQRVQTTMTATSITCSRTIRGKSGDEYVAMTVGIDSVRDEDPSQHSIPVRGLPLCDAPVAAAILAMEVDVAAHEHAASSGVISPDCAEKFNRMIKANFLTLMEKAVKQAEKARGSRD